MNTITINGVEYQRASILGKEFKYTSDYIGQLCRGHKVDAQLVGRTWYVNPLSLKSHKKSRYTKSTPDEKTSEYKVEINKSRIEIEPQITKNTLKTVFPKNNNFVRRIDWKPVKYKIDEADLLPSLGDSKKRINVDLAESSTVPIKSTKESIHMEPEPLPTVSLSGTLRIASLDEAYLNEDDQNDVVLQPKATVLGEEILGNRLNFLKRARISKQKFSDIDVKPSQVVVNSDLLTPELVKEAKSINEITSTFRWLSILIISLLFLYIFLLLFFNFNISATATTFENNFYFSSELFDSLFSLF